MTAANLQGNTVCLAVTDTSHAATQIVGSTTLGSYQVILNNAGANTAFINIGQNSSVAAAVIPTDGTPAAGYPILGGSIQTLSLAPNSWLTAICATGLTTTLYITPVGGD